MSVAVIIPVYGNTSLWSVHAHFAAESVHNQSSPATSTFIAHGENIQDCRNHAANINHDCEFLIFLDADDELHPNYIEEMLKGTGDIRVPAVHRYYEDGRIDTVQREPKPLITGNYIVIGAMIRTELFKRLGGFHNYESLEDWDLWLRAEEAGATFEQIPTAIYKVHKRVGSRNSNVSHNEILKKAKQRRGL